MAVRRDAASNTEWADVATMAYTEEGARRQSRATKDARSFAEGNPTVRIARFTITEAA